MTFILRTVFQIPSKNLISLKKHGCYGVWSLFHIWLFYKYCLFSAYLCHNFNKSQAIFIELHKIVNHHKGYLLINGHSSVMQFYQIISLYWIGKNTDMAIASVLLKHSNQTSHICSPSQGQHFDKGPSLFYAFRLNDLPLWT